MIAAATLALLQALLPSEETKNGIVWAKDLETAMAQSSRDGRPVLLFFSFDT
ncbi:MAG TPA: hypothetical protein VFI25_18765 [Planctomycetota bacterium]|nr:hypothetical protein [Planctomycetota bacterium]